MNNLVYVSGLSFINRLILSSVLWAFFAAGDGSSGSRLVAWDDELSDIAFYPVEVIAVIACLFSFAARIGVAVVC